MKQLIVILLLLAAGSSIAACEELKSGNAGIDLGDGYKVSFLLPDIGTPYEVILYPMSVAKFPGSSKEYGFSIYSDGIILVNVSLIVFPSSLPEFMNYTPNARAYYDSEAPEIIGSRVVIPRAIDKAPGYVAYDLQKGASRDDIGKAVKGYFRYFPGAQNASKEVSAAIGESLVCPFWVEGDFGEFPAPSQFLQVFNSIVDSIHISGPGMS